MKLSLNKISIAVAAATLSMAMNHTVSAEEAAAPMTVLEKIAAESTTKVNLRYRYEYVDQDGNDLTANANTLKTRISWTSGAVANTKAILEFDHVADFGKNRYNDKLNGKANPVIADPVGTDLNQAALQYKNDMVTATAGRQRITLDDQRFVGGVAWRQNEQTYDAARVQVKPMDMLALDYSYVARVNTILGGEKDGQIHLVNAAVTPVKGQKVVVFDYAIDMDGATSDTNTLGLRYTGDFGVVKVAASYAQQAIDNDNGDDYSTSYMALDLSGKAGPVGLNIGREVLGSDDGKASFDTPLATKHKFQGFADKFLNIGTNGIEDTYVGANGKVAGVKLVAAYHDFKSVEGSIDYGSEVDVAVIYPVNKQLKVVGKLANYSAGDIATDTQKAWLQVQLAL